MNLPNQLTVARLVLTAVFVVCFYLPVAHHLTIAALVFGVASITDYFDGRIARARGIVTNFGKLFDPLADKILIAAAFILLVERGDLPAWVVVVMLAREFFVTGIRLIAAGQGAILVAERLGKHKMFWQILTVSWFLVKEASVEPLFSFAKPFYATAPGWVADVIIYFTTLLTLVSGFSYFWKNRQLFNDA
ncbi:MAG: CDP-diacylglycerol--glycerol-3-phosphate 3-phosphatidyltransferase [Prosthecobacter sp.]|jgi:CDP-diacylglycerol--glycerol-3-phosphate 3-phosphatidyltransferase|uniref:CDP-diacylglycerol--glycerol-3-phosphate 3-phosphatidyltransferase n=1 Tax=Prosthecobacter sp. TaxID=1965333 RepID=UPI0019FB4E51|nr:CDP-diacylglycerol--glycerol-3-phosphate 3-phosphatidyltransferase [Prosthecobacter sp.]MBE2287834.1 CDP-diacylglycerol--glycerol-3-phosphate 3-phosphatidyltransferase [Prosthecobacter sp.]